MSDHPTLCLLDGFLPQRVKRAGFIETKEAINPHEKISPTEQRGIPVQGWNSGKIHRFQWLHKEFFNSVFFGKRAERAMREND